MQKKPLYFILLCLCWSLQLQKLNASALQENDTIKAVNFEQAEKHSITFLKNLIKCKVGEPFDQASLDEDVQTLINLPSITNAIVELDSLQNGYELTFILEEALTFFPLVNFGGVKDNVWFSLGFKEINLKGRQQQIAAQYQNIDSRSGYEVFTSAPNIKGSKWGVDFNAKRYASIEPFYFPDEDEVFYQYTNYSVGSNALYDFSNDHRASLGVTYFTENYNKDERHQGQITAGPETNRERKGLVKFSDLISHLDYHFYFVEGLENDLKIQSVYSFKDKDVFNILINDTKYFKRVGKKGNFATRLRLGLSTNSESPFSPFVLDNNINIRGVGNRVDRGTAAVILNTEYRQTVFDKGKFASQLVGFTDAGSWRNPGGTLNDITSSENIQHFAGLGTRLIYKKAFNTSLRIDYSWNLKGPSQQEGFVIGFGQYF